MMRHALILPLWLGAAAAQAAGHFDVDDAGTLDPGRCQYELWAGRFRDARANVWHAGPSCRVGLVELGLNYDGVSVNGGRTDTVGPQLKWTFLGSAPDAMLSAALSVSTAFDFPRHGGGMGGQFVLPVTWHATGSLQVHFNAGADWATTSGARTVRHGMAGEWAVNDMLSLIAERNRAYGLWTSRIGTRLSVTPMISIDFSVSRAGPGRSRGTMVGLNHEFGR
jgi:hypothetical protein